MKESYLDAHAILIREQGRLSSHRQPELTRAVVSLPTTLGQHDMKNRLFFGTFLAICILPGFFAAAAPQGESIDKNPTSKPQIVGFGFENEQQGTTPKEWKMMGRPDFSAFLSNENAKSGDTLGINQRN